MASPFTQQTSTSSTSLLPPHNAFNDPRRASNRSQTSQVSYQSSLAEKFSLAPSPAQWGMPNLNQPEDDDYLHNPDPTRDRKDDRGSSIFTARGVANLGCLAILVLGITMLFAGWPIITHFLTKKQTTQGGFNLGGINATGQIADIPGNWGLIDKDTPKDAYTKSSYVNPGDKWELVFSDEFNQDGRTFWPGDDPYWEAVDLHYWGTNDLEWYDPSGASTGNGTLNLKLEKVDDPSSNHNLSYKSGMVQTWNKFCFTGGIIEASVLLPGTSTVHGLWPAVWTMGNLGRAGFGATLEGTWPYSYDFCDVGTLHNQTYPPPRQNLPEYAVAHGDQFNDGVLSYMPGQRLSACTCPGESHPGPVRSDGTYVGRAAPEIDLFEATVTDGIGQVSQSSQWAPFNAEYKWFNTTDNYDIVDPTITTLNEYVGGVFQQTTSGLSHTNQGCYELEAEKCYSIYGFEYKPGFDNAYISWINNGKLAWTIKSGGLAADPRVDIHARPIPQEPMYIIANLGFSINFGGIDFENVKLPATMRVDWIRVYQPPDARNIGCDPPDFPTKNYIDTYKAAYTNPNYTTWVDDFKQPWPKNRLETPDCV